MAKFALVRCRVPNGVLLRTFELKPEIPGSAMPVGRPTGREFNLLHGDRNVVPLEFWAEWEAQHPSGLPLIDKVGEIGSD
jgi:hypothetical protein